MTDLCRTCGSPFPVAPRGRPRLYCSRACKPYRQDRSRERAADRVGGTNHEHRLERQRQWRSAHPDEVRRASRESYARNHYRWHRASAVATLPPIPTLHHGHPLFEIAWAIVPDRTPARPFVSCGDPLDEDLRSEVVLAILEGRDPREAVDRYRSIEHTWKAKARPLFEEIAA